MNSTSSSRGGPPCPPSALPAVRLDAVEKRFGAVLAVAPLTISVDRGETVALLGPSGAGKTTVLKLIAAAERPTGGAVRLLGRELYGMTPGRELAALVGMVHQQFDLVPSLSALHNVLAGRLGEWSFVKSLVSLAIPVDRHLAMSALDRVGIGGKASERVSRLSGGEQQRVAIARVLVQDPEIILADEPVASLDPARSDEILFLLASLARDSSKTLIASMHSTAHARESFDRLIGLRNGRLQFDLPASEVTDALLTGLYALEGLRAES